jgi:hypothetical protein
MRNDGLFGKFKTFSKKGQHIWMERVTFYNFLLLTENKDTLLKF